MQRLDVGSFSVYCSFSLWSLWEILSNSVIKKDSRLGFEWTLRQLKSVSLTYFHMKKCLLVIKRPCECSVFSSHFKWSIMYYANNLTILLCVPLITSLGYHAIMLFQQHVLCHLVLCSHWKHQDGLFSKWNHCSCHLLPFHLNECPKLRVNSGNYVFRLDRGNRQESTGI